MNTTSPFRFTVRDLIGHPGAMHERALTIACPEDLGVGLVAVTAGESMRLDVRFESVHEGVLVTATVVTRATGECGRCLDPVVIPLNVEFRELFAYHSGEAFEYEVQDDHVNLEPSIRDAVVLALPFQPVCEPDCPGLDPETGERRASSPGLERRSAPDSRWEALAAYRASDAHRRGASTGAPNAKKE